MPFDALTLTRVGSLHETLAAYGIEPVSLVYLERHKTEQVRLAPASFLVTWKPWGIVALLTAACGVWLGSVLSALMLTVGFVAALHTIRAAYSMFKPLVRQGRWVEYREVPCWSAPAPIARVARLLKDAHPDGTLIIGKLEQSKVVLDPYLLFELNGQRVCLGIWDTGRIIATAKYV